MKVFTSNTLAKLAKQLGSLLFDPHRDPFQRIQILVPSNHVKQFLMYFWAQHFGIATGVNFICVDTFIQQFFPHLPPAIELALRIEVAIDHADRHQCLELFEYLNKGGSQRKLALCNTLAQVFINYALYADDLAEWLKITSWQQYLWRAVLGDSQQVRKHQALQGSLFMFHCSDLPPQLIDTLAPFVNGWFLLSPTPLYWGDLLSTKSQQTLLKKTHSSARKQLENYFHEDPPFLTLCARVGKQIQQWIEQYETVEDFIEHENTSLLHCIQNDLLNMQSGSHPIDDSIQLHAAPSRAREIEIVWETIRQTGIEPKQVIVLAPDIEAYISDIQRVFGSVESNIDAAIFGISTLRVSSLAQGFKTLFTLIDENWSKQSVLALMHHSHIATHSTQITLWIEEAYIYGGWEGHNSWEAGLCRLVLALASPLSERRPVLLQEDADLLDLWIQWIYQLKNLIDEISTAKSLLEWSNFLQRLTKTIFPIQERDQIFLEGLKTLPNVEGAQFSFATVRDYIEKLMQQKHASLPSSSRQAVRFASLHSGIAVPADMIFLIGMEEGVFPRNERRLSLQELLLPTRLSLADKDRFLFLELFLCVQKKFILSYCYRSSQDGAALAPLPILDELFPWLKQTTIHHPYLPFDAAYFSGKMLFSTSNLYQAASAKYYGINRPMYSLLSPERRLHTGNLRITIRDLQRLGRNPLRFFLERSLSMYLPWQDTDSPELVLPRYEINNIKNLALKKPLLEVLKEEEASGRMPVGSFTILAKEKIAQAVDDYLGSLTTFGVAPNHLFSIELKRGNFSPMQNKEGGWIAPAVEIKASSGHTIIVEGLIENVSPYGLFVDRSDHLADLLISWPVWLITQSLPFCKEKNLLCGKNRRTIKPLENLDSYLSMYGDYILSAMGSASPLCAAWGTSLLAKNEYDFIQTVEASQEQDDAYIRWLRQRQLLPDLTLWYRNWHPYLQEVFGEAFQYS